MQKYLNFSLANIETVPDNYVMVSLTNHVNRFLVFFDPLSPPWLTALLYKIYLVTLTFH